MKLRLMALTLVLALLGLFVGPLTTSAATPVTPGATGTTLSGPAATRLAHSPFEGIQVNGTARSATASTSAATSGTFQGRVTVERFLVQNGQLVAQVSVKGTVTTAAGTQTVSTEATTPAQASGTCNILNLHLAPLHLNLLGLVVDTSDIYLTITGQTGQGLLLGNLLCAISGLFHTPGPLANLLNSLLAGIAATLATVNTHFVASNGQLYAVTTSGGKVVGIAPAQVSGTCSVLNLTLGPLHLNLLGLIIDLNGGVDSTTGNTLPITVTITGQQGTLLGGLVCGIANLLNGPNPNLSSVATLLNTLFALLRL
jgi:hypothetical protein